MHVVQQEYAGTPVCKACMNLDITLTLQKQNMQLKHHCFKTTLRDKQCAVV